MTPRAEPIHFAVPGPVDQPTGGYRYDAAIICALRALGRDVTLHELAGRFPLADDRARDAARRCLAASGTAILLIDGLALPAFADLLGDARARVIALVHHPLALETGLPPAQRRLLDALESRLARATRGVIVTSAATIPDIRAWGVARERIAVVTPAVAAARIGARRARDSLRLLCVASLTPRKGHRTLLAALARLRDRRWRLDCIGPAHFDSREAGRIRATIALRRLARRVCLRGALPPPRVMRAYAAADLFVLPSFLEGYGMAFAEAIASGVPVLGGRAGAVPTTVPSRAGELVRPGDARALARALARLLARPDRRRRLRRGAIAAARDFPDWRRQALAFAAATDALAR
jgi:glycosyltransferase involved in cell wall biosynthesis